MKCPIVSHVSCYDGLKAVGIHSVDLVVTSPPYKVEDGYDHCMFREVFKRLYLRMKPNTLVFMNFGHLKDWKTRPFEVVELMCSAGFRLHDTIIWVKNHYTPLQGNNLNNLFEYIFMFTNGVCPNLDRLAIGIPYADKSNVGRYSASDVKCRGNVWYVNYPTIQSSDQKYHKDRFPIEIPSLCIRLAGLKRMALVLDPFAGSGTTGVAAIQHKMNFIGFEINKEVVKIANQRLLEVWNEHHPVQSR